MRKILPIIFLVLTFQSCSDDNDVVIPPANMYGCMDLTACNIDIQANINDASCWYDTANDTECGCFGINPDFTTSNSSQKLYQLITDILNNKQNINGQMFEM